MVCFWTWRTVWSVLSRWLVVSSSVFTEYSSEQWEVNVILYLTNTYLWFSTTRKSNTDISAMLNIWRSTVNDIVTSSKCKDCIEPIPQKVQPRMFVTQNECYIVRKIKAPTFCAPQLTSALLKRSIEKVTSQYKIY